MEPNIGSLNQELMSVRPQPAAICVQGVQFGLFGGHIFERADDATEGGEHRSLGQLLVQRLGDS